MITYPVVITARQRSDEGYVFSCVCLATGRGCLYRNLAPGPQPPLYAPWQFQTGWTWNSLGYVQTCSLCSLHYERQAVGIQLKCLLVYLQQTKRKLEDVLRKLETLYDKLRENRVSNLASNVVDFSVKQTLKIIVLYSLKNSKLT